MKKLLLVLSLIAISLSGCYIYDHDDGYHRDRDYNRDHDHDRGHDHRDGDRHDDDRYDRGRY